MRLQMRSVPIASGLPKISWINRLWISTGESWYAVNDVRMVMIPSGTYAIAVDVGVEAFYGVSASGDSSKPPWILLTSAFPER